MTEVVLTAEEQRALRKIVRGRIIFFFVIICPLSAFLVYLLYLALMSFVEGSQDAFSYCYPLLFIVYYALAYKYVMPQYSNILLYRKARTKQVIQTSVLEIFHVNQRPYIKTDVAVLNTASTPVLFWEISALDIAVGTTLYLHRIPGVKKELLRVTTTPLDS